MYSTFTVWHVTVTSDTRQCTHTYVLCIYIHMFICIYIHTYVCTYTYVPTYIYIHTYVYACMYVSVHTYMYVCMCVHTYKQSRVLWSQRLVLGQTGQGEEQVQREATTRNTSECTYVCMYVCTHIVHIIQAQAGTWAYNVNLLMT